MTKPHSSMTFTAEEMEFVHQAVREYRTSLEKHRSWLHSTDGKTLPGAVIAIGEISKEISIYAAIELRVYRETLCPK